MNSERESKVTTAELEKSNKVKIRSTSKLFYKTITILVLLIVAGMGLFVSILSDEDSKDGFWLMEIQPTPYEQIYNYLEIIENTPASVERDAFASTIKTSLLDEEITEDEYRAISSHYGEYREKTYKKKVLAALSKPAFSE